LPTERLAKLLKATRTLAPALVASLGLAVLAVAVLVFVNSDGYGYDFRAYDAAARRLTTGQPLYLPGSVEAYRDGRYQGLYLYPPIVAAAFVPLTVLTEQAAVLVWVLLRAGLLIAGCLALPVSLRTRATILGVACVSFPVLFDLNIGNISIVVFALSAAAWRWMDSPGAAVAHALLIALRFPFGIFAVTWVAQRRWRALAATVAAGLLLIVMSLPLVGASSYLEYVAIIRGLPDISVGQHNLSFKSLALDLGLADPVASLALPLGYALGIVAIVFAGRRRDASTAFVVTITATLFVAPFLHPHYLVLLLLPSAWLMDRGHWWAFGLPLLGWLPDAFLPLAAPLAIALVLLASNSQRGLEDPVAPASAPKLQQIV
jgi:hypothetical protein